MIIQSKVVQGKKLIWNLRSSIKEDASELSVIRLKIDGETEFLDREPGENFLSPLDFEKLIYEDSIAEKNIFLVAETEGKIVGFSRLQGNNLSRFRHKAEFGICILKDYWGCGIGNSMLESILLFADANHIEKITLCVVETNIKAIELYEKYGFKKEGLLEKDRIHKDGSYYNTVLMGRLANR